MLQKTRFLVRTASSIAVLILASAIAPTAANAGSVANLMHPYFAARTANVQIKLYNKGVVSQDVKVNDKVYTVKPHASVTINAPAGTRCSPPPPAPTISPETCCLPSLPNWTAQPSRSTRAADASRESSRVPHISILRCGVLPRAVNSSCLSFRSFSVIPQRSGGICFSALPLFFRASNRAHPN
jgi:hypothetical protein